MVLCALKNLSSSIDFKISVSSSPMKIETIAGGASFAPRRWSFPAPEADTRIKSAYSSTALITATKNTKN